MTFPRILGIELVGGVEVVHGNPPAVPPGTTVADLMGEMGRAFDGSYAEYALVPEHQLIALESHSKPRCRGTCSARCSRRS